MLISIIHNNLPCLFTVLANLQLKVKTISKQSIFLKRKEIPVKSKSLFEIVAFHSSFEKLKVNCLHITLEIN